MAGTAARHPSTFSPWRLGEALFFLLALAALAMFLFPFWAPASPLAQAGAEGTGEPSRALLLVVTLCTVLLLLGLLGEAQAGLTALTVAMLGTLVGLNTALRVAENVIPLPGGFTPVFLLIGLVGFTFGPRLGFLMGALTMLVSGPLTAGGLGPWTPYQMVAAGWLGLAAAWLPRGRLTIVSLAVYLTLWGWLYGALTNLYFWPYTLLAPDLGWTAGLGWSETLTRYGRFYLATSLLWDTAGALGNLALVLLAGRPLLEALERFRRRAHVVWEPA
jgi:energy-coupling factor transport system substrate-specific component